MPYVSSGALSYYFPHLVVNRGLKEKEGSLARELAIECLDLHKRVQQLEHLEYTLKPEVEKLKAENAFLTKLIGQLKIGENE